MQSDFYGAPSQICLSNSTTVVYGYISNDSPFFGAAAGSNSLIRQNPQVNSVNTGFIDLFTNGDVNAFCGVYCGRNSTGQPSNQATYNTTSIFNNYQATTYSLLINVYYGTPSNTSYRCLQRIGFMSALGQKTPTGVYFEFNQASDTYWMFCYTTGSGTTVTRVPTTIVGSTNNTYGTLLLGIDIDINRNVSYSIASVSTSYTGTLAAANVPAMNNYAAGAEVYMPAASQFSSYMSVDFIDYVVTQVSGSRGLN
jgi:hypothetical protein